MIEMSVFFAEISNIGGARSEAPIIIQQEFQGNFGKISKILVQRRYISEKIEIERGTTCGGNGREHKKSLFEFFFLNLSIFKLLFFNISFILNLYYHFILYYPFIFNYFLYLSH